MKVKAIKDFKGKQYPSITAMCKSYNMPYDLVRDRLSKGFSVKDALTVPLGYRRIKSVDHLGHEFSCEAEMCRFWGINPAIYRYRFKVQGLSLKDSLTLKGRCRHVVTDHKGNTFASVYQMCRFWEICPSTYTYRLNKGLSQSVALTAKVQDWNHASKSS